MQGNIVDGFPWIRVNKSSAVEVEHGNMGKKYQIAKRLYYAYHPFGFRKHCTTYRILARIKATGVASTRFSCESNAISVTSLITLLDLYTYIVVDIYNHGLESNNKNLLYCTHVQSYCSNISQELVGPPFYIVVHMYNQDLESNNKNLYQSTLLDLPPLYIVVDIYNQNLLYCPLMSRVIAVTYLSSLFDLHFTLL